MPEKALKILEELKVKDGKVIELSKGAARNGFDKARKKAGLETLRFHDLRHIAISRMWRSGMNALEISACSGHKDIKMLMRYSHFQLTKKSVVPNRGVLASYRSYKTKKIFG